MPWKIIFAVVIWLIWYWWNSSLHDHEFHWLANAMQQILVKAKKKWMVLSNFNRRLSYEYMVRWTKPDNNFIKINVDGRVRSQLEIVGAGGVMCDENGNWICGFVYRVGRACVITSELWAIYQGLMICWKKGYKMVELETDLVLAIQKVRSQ
ncbi:hypothetical protein REPUB_Repub11eG0183100 [Reevesia pubescens]